MGASVSIAIQPNIQEQLYLRYNTLIENSLWLALVLNNVKTGCIIKYKLDQIKQIEQFEKILNTSAINFLRFEQLDDKKKIKEISYIISKNTIDEKYLNTYDSEKYYQYLNYLLGEDIFITNFEKKKDMMVVYSHNLNNCKERIFFIQHTKKQFDVNVIMESGKYRKELEFEIKKIMPNLFSKIDVCVEFVTK